MRSVVKIAAAAAAFFAFAGAAHAGDAVEGEKVFKKCAACHAVGEGAKNKVGPVLNNIIGAKSGSVADYKYSKAAQDASAGGLVWTEDKLTVYLADPKAFMPGNKMAFAGLKKPEEIANVIAYLKTYSPNAPK